MIVRILGEGQLEIPDSGAAELDQLDEQLLHAVESGDEARFAVAFQALLDRARALGSPLPNEVLKPSDLVLPSPDAGLAEVRELLRNDGLIQE